MGTKIRTSANVIETLRARETERERERERERKREREREKRRESENKRKRARGKERGNERQREKERKKKREPHQTVGHTIRVKLFCGTADRRPMPPHTHTHVLVECSMFLPRTSRVTPEQRQ